MLANLGSHPLSLHYQSCCSKSPLAPHLSHHAHLIARFFNDQMVRVRLPCVAHRISCPCDRVDLDICCSPHYPPYVRHLLPFFMFVLGRSESNFSSVCPCHYSILGHFRELVLHFWKVLSVIVLLKHPDAFAPSFHQWWQQFLQFSGRSLSCLPESKHQFSEPILW